MKENFMDQLDIQEQVDKQEYVKPVLTTIEIAARELLGTGGEPPEG